MFILNIPTGGLTPVRRRLISAALREDDTSSDERGRGIGLGFSHSESSDTQAGDDNQSDSPLPDMVSVSSSSDSSETASSDDDSDEDMEADVRNRSGAKRHQRMRGRASKSSRRQPGRPTRPREHPKGDRSGSPRRAAAKEKRSSRLAEADAATTRRIAETGRGGESEPSKSNKRTLASSAAPRAGPTSVRKADNRATTATPSTSGGTKKLTSVGGGNGFKFHVPKAKQSGPWRHQRGRKSYYAVASGPKPGIYTDWNDVRHMRAKQLRGFNDLE